MYLCTFSVKVQSMLLQKLNGVRSWKLEEGDWQLLLSHIPSNAVANYNHYSTNILHNQSMSKFLTVSIVDLLLITVPEYFSPVAPPFTGHDGDNTILVQHEIANIVTNSDTFTYMTRWQQSTINNRWLEFASLLTISLNLLHILQLDSGSVVQPRLTSFGISTRMFISQ